MRSVIAQYATFSEAQWAVRQLEPHLSIQDVVVTHDPHVRAAAPDSQGVPAEARGFVVSMMGERDVIARARALIAAPRDARRSTAARPAIVPPSNQEETPS